MSNAGTEGVERIGGAEVHYVHTLHTFTPELYRITRMKLYSPERKDFVSILGHLVSKNIHALTFFFLFLTKTDSDALLN